MNEDTRLPFAVDEDHNTGLHLLRETQSESLVTVQIDGPITYPSQSALPALASSMISCRSDDTTQASSTMSELVGSAQWPSTKASVFAGDMLSSRQLDAAASLMAESYLPQLSSLYDPAKSASPPVARDEIPSNDVASTITLGSYASMEFSRLMQNADDSHGQNLTLKRGPVLPVLQEEADASFHSAQGDRSSSFPSNIASTSSCVMSSDWLQIDNDTQQNIGGYQSPQLYDQVSGENSQSQETRSLDQSVLRRTGVAVRQLDPVSFEVHVDLAPHCTVDNAMEVVANPVHLALWCDSIRSLLIASCSEGATAAVARDETSSNGRQYDGEWIEATTTELVPPCTSSCFSSTKKAMWNYVGFPSNYGTISMFVERKRGRVGLSIGPFDGDVTVSHSISVTNMKITNTVTLSRAVSSTEVFCGLFECLESFFLPTLKGYTDQVVSSMIRLRLLIETSKRGSSSSTTSTLQ